MAATYTHVLVLDFDGTVCLGDGPVFAYARLLDEALASGDGVATEDAGANDDDADADATVGAGAGANAHAAEEGAEADDSPTPKARANAEHEADTANDDAFGVNGANANRDSATATAGAGARASSASGARGATGEDDRRLRHRPGLVLATLERFLGPEEIRASALPSAEPQTAPSEPATRDGGAGQNETSPAAARSTLSLDEAIALVQGSVDGYEAAERLGRALGATSAQLSAAYAGSREELASGAIETCAPDGLADLLLGLPATVQVVLVTNAPETGVTQQLRHLGLSDCFAELVTSAGKPAGMAAIVERLLAQNELAGHPERLLSVGDIWRNDLAPAAGLGCATALIERHPAPTDARPTFRAADIRQLYPAIISWATSS